MMLMWLFWFCSYISSSVSVNVLLCILSMVLVMFVWLLLIQVWFRLMVLKQMMKFSSVNRRFQLFVWCGLLVVMLMFSSIMLMLVMIQLKCQVSLLLLCGDCVCSSVSVVVVLGGRVLLLCIIWLFVSMVYCLKWVMVLLLVFRFVLFCWLCFSIRKWLLFICLIWFCDEVVIVL